MPLANKDVWYPEEIYKLLCNERLSARAKLLVWFLGSAADGIQIGQEDLSRIVSTNSKSEALTKAVEEAEREGYLEVDRTVRPYRYLVK